MHWHALQGLGRPGLVKAGTAIFYRMLAEQVKPQLPAYPPHMTYHMWLTHLWELWIGIPVKDVQGFLCYLLSGHMPHRKAGWTAQVHSVIYG